MAGKERREPGWDLSLEKAAKEVQSQALCEAEKGQERVTGLPDWERLLV